MKANLGFERRREVALVLVRVVEVSIALVAADIGEESVVFFSAEGKERITREKCRRSRGGTVNSRQLLLLLLLLQEQLLRIIRIATADDPDGMLGGTTSRGEKAGLIRVSCHSLRGRKLERKRGQWSVKEVGFCAGRESEREW